MTNQELVARLGGVDTVTAAEASEVIAWCREWASDTFEDFEACSHWSDDAILRRCHLLIDGGLRFVLSDVRSLATV